MSRKFEVYFYITSSRDLTEYARLMEQGSTNEAKNLVYMSTTPGMETRGWHLLGTKVVVVPEFDHIAVINEQEKVIQEARKNAIERHEANLRILDEDLSLIKSQGV